MQSTPETQSKTEKKLILKGARTNNLKNIDLEIPLKKFTVVTGVSGSGKSSLAFETLYAEGQRRYLESLSTYARQFLEKMPKPDIDSLQNIPPAVALEQKNHINNSRSTVATMCEVYDYLRLLFAKIGKTFCSNCNRLVEKDSADTVLKFIQDQQNKKLYVLSPLQFTKETFQDSRKALIKSGFDRVLLSKKKGEPELTELTILTEYPKNTTCYLVIDRLSVSQETSRLYEALENAFEHGLGKMTIAFVEDWSFHNFSNQFRCDRCDINYQEPEPQFFSFNSPLGACPGCNGFGYNLELDEALVVPDPKKTLRNGAVDPFTKPAYVGWHEDLIEFCEKHKINTGKRYEELTPSEKDLIWNGDPKGKKKDFQGIRGCFEELGEWKYKLHVRVFIRRFQSQFLCQECKGSRLRKEVKAVLIGTTEQSKENAKNIQEILSMSVEDANRYFQNLKLNVTEKKISEDVLKQILGRLIFLDQVGVGYLTLQRLSKTLSGGECQRINLATQLGNKLCDTLYVLDEPSIGLHPSDTEKLIQLLEELRDQGNTLVVVEHDLQVIKKADHIVELGPFAGYRGGEVVAQGNKDNFSKEKGSLTAKYLNGDFSIPTRKTLRGQTERQLKIRGASENNLKNIDANFPLGNLIAVTGVSGSGKSTLVHKTLYNALHRLFHREPVSVGRFTKIYGTEFLKDVVLLDQKPIGKTARSNPATYLKIWDDVRKIFANQSMSIRRGYSPSHFSFNVDGGRCPVCKGEGEVTIDMHFMADLKLPCEECSGKKFKKTILEVEFKKKNVHDLLQTTIDECIDLFREYPAVNVKLQTLKKVGLGYLHLGQSATTLSGGEAQRLKIASVLEERSDSNVLYIFDEPTTGLHSEDVKKLIEVLHDLVDRKNTVIVVEHNTDLIAQADWIVDLGPGGGVHGGHLVAQGPPNVIRAEASSLTGKFLINE
ncbi:MAG: excinuclease ABC subunit UvrA [Bacteriovoracia bacterium]